MAVIKIKWLADVEVNERLVVAEGQDPVLVSLHKNSVVEVTEGDPFIRRAIARGYAKVMAEAKKVEPPAEPEATDEDVEDNQEEAE